MIKNSIMFTQGFSVLLLAVFSSHIMAQEYIGKLVWANKVELTTPVAGVVDVVHVNTGMKVNRGDDLVTLEPSLFKIRIKESQAQLDKFVALRDEARREFERAKNLYERTLLSEHELQVANIAYITHDSDFESARERLAQAKMDYEYSMLRAPFNAVVIKRLAEKGMVVTPKLQSQILVVIAHGNKMLARAKISAGDLSQIQYDQLVQVIVDGEEYKGKVKHKGMEPISVNGTEYNLDIEFSTNGKQFVAGQQAKIEL